MKKPSKNEPDIAGLLTKITEQLAALDRKVETLATLVSRPQTQAPVARPSVAPSSQPPVHPQAQGNARPNDNRPRRPMFAAVCADCKKNCEIPFQPSKDRPVYCQECFSRRKSRGPADNKPKAAPSLPSVIDAAIDIPETPAKDKRRPAAARRPAPKKKPVQQKKKK